ncbi:ATP-binding protein, partial [bacterium]|nr:ATP-binding protein [bacterium]
GDARPFSAEAQLRVGRGAGIAGACQDDDEGAHRQEHHACEQVRRVQFLMDRAESQRQVAAEPVALIDRKLARRALENLIANAVKYSPRGQPVDIEARVGERGIEIDVADRGPGIPDELKGTMFEKFGSVEVSRGEARRGYGLGLHLVKLAAEAHGGGVSVRDREGGGSIFRLVLPQMSG